MYPRNSLAQTLLAFGAFWAVHSEAAKLKRLKATYKAPAMGRSFLLGAFYNMRSDQIVEVHGSPDKLKDSDVSTLTFSYKTTTHNKKLPMEALGNIGYPKQNPGYFKRSKRLKYPYPKRTNKLKLNGLGATFRVPALGRPFSLGAFYDARSDQIVDPGLSPWKQVTIDKYKRKEPASSTDATVDNDTSFSDRASSLNVHAELQLSFLAGLIKVDGSAEYLKDSHASTETESLSLSYKSTTHTEKLPMEVLGNIEYPQHLDNVDATHVVTMIQYGANAIFHFSAKTTNKYDRQDISGSLKDIVRGIMFSVSGSAKLNLTDKQKDMASGFHCDLKTDILIPHPPTNWEDALKVYNSSMMKINESTAVPMTVYLMPLEDLGSKTHRIIRTIDADILNVITTHVNELDVVDKRVNTLKGSKNYQDVVLFRDRVDYFGREFAVYRQRFTNALGQILPSVRNGSLVQSSLPDLVEGMEKGMSVQYIKDWTDARIREAESIQGMIGWIPDAWVTAHQFVALRFDEHITYLVSLEVGLNAKGDQFVDCLNKQCKAAEKKVDSWIWKAEVINKLINVFEQYKAMIEANAANDNRTSVKTRFVVRELQDPKQDVDVSVKIYYNHKLHHDNFEPQEMKNVTYECIGGMKLVVHAEVSSANYPVHLLWRIAPTGDWHETQSKGFPIFVDLSEETTENCQDIDIGIWIQYEFGRGPMQNFSTGKTPLRNIGLLLYERDGKSFEMFYPWNHLKNITIRKHLYADNAQMLMLSTGNILMTGFDEHNGKIIEIINLKNGTFSQLDIPQVFDGIGKGFAITRIGHDPLLCGGDGSKSCIRFHNEKWIHDSDMIAVRSGHTLTTCAGFTFALAGNGTDSGLSSTEIYDARTGSWRYWHPLPTDLSGHRSACMDNILYVCGGQKSKVLHAQRTCHKHVLGPAMDSNKWKAVASMNVGRQEFTLVAAGGKLIALGGRVDKQGEHKQGQKYTSSTLVEMYDPNTNAWTLLSRELAAGVETSAVVVFDGGDIHF